MTTPYCSPPLIWRHNPGGDTIIIRSSMDGASRPGVPTRVRPPPIVLEGDSTCPRLRLLFHERVLVPGETFTHPVGCCGGDVPADRTSAGGTDSRQAADPLVTQMVCEFLQRGHLTRPMIGDEISRTAVPAAFSRTSIPASSTSSKRHRRVQEIRNRAGRHAPQGRPQLRLQGLRAAVRSASANGRSSSRSSSTPSSISPSRNTWTPITTRSTMRPTRRSCATAGGNGSNSICCCNASARSRCPRPRPRRRCSIATTDSLKRWKQIDNFDLLEIYLSDLTTSLDPHWTYMSPTTLDDFEIAMRLNLDGIGAVLR